MQEKLISYFLASATLTELDNDLRATRKVLKK